MNRSRWSWLFLSTLAAAALSLAACKDGDDATVVSGSATAESAAPAAAATPTGAAGDLLAVLLSGHQAATELEAFSAEITLSGAVAGDSLGLTMELRAQGTEQAYIVAQLDVPGAAGTGLASLGSFEVLLTEGRLFLLIGEGPWMELPVDATTGLDPTGQLSPQLLQALTQLYTLVEVEKLEAEEVNGHQSLHYRLSVDLQTLLPALLGLLAGQLPGVLPGAGALPGFDATQLAQVSGDLTLDLWFDQESSLFRRAEGRLEASAPEETGVQQSVALDFTASFDYVTPVHIPAAPPGAVPFDPSSLGL